MVNVRGSSSGATRVPRVPERHKGRWDPSQMVEADFEIFYIEYRFPRGTRFCLPSVDETPYTDGAKGEMCFVKAPLKSRSFYGFIHPFVLPKLTNFGIFIIVIKGFPRLLLTWILTRGGMIVTFSCLVLDENASPVRTTEVSLLCVGCLDLFQITIGGKSQALL
ncbi:hypothetical protein CJ030_MR0G008004 [Morella rubra]|uniref:Uncharacterized protein n=1 Tax=Morella rubra TaxID=262757 RepID=A0A6A1UJG1_9ROSI|nr:hypothetical protein CJ030_MR0G008004 [Morella rubra]